MKELIEQINALCDAVKAIPEGNPAELCRGFNEKYYSEISNYYN